MRTALVMLLTAAPLTLAVAPAQAQSSATAATAITNGNLNAAERDLLAELRIHPNRPELLLNLAVVYSKTGRAGEARNLYQQVLAQDDVLMDLSADRTAGSHAIARSGLRRIDAVQTASY